MSKFSFKAAAARDLDLICVVSMAEDGRMAAVSNSISFILQKAAVLTASLLCGWVSTMRCLLLSTCFRAEISTDCCPF